MSNQPEETNKNTRKAAENDIEQPEPVNKQDPTGPVSVKSKAAGGEAPAL